MLRFDRTSLGRVLMVVKTFGVGKFGGGSCVGSAELLNDRVNLLND